tara:strand:+ start:417 stop:1328 length:912 start_codon:yes stop_codon:yes gene_type:complete
MVRSYLIKNRICYKSDGGSSSGGGSGDRISVTAGQDNVDRSNPAEMRAREQAFEDQIIRQTRPDIEVGSDEARDTFANFVSNPNQGVANQVAAVQRAERAAAERQAANIRSGGGTDLPQAFTSAAAYQDLTDRTQRPIPTMGVGDVQLPNILGAALTGIGNANMANVKSKIDAGGTPIFNEGQIVGVTSPGLFGGTVYSGRPEFNPFAMPMNDDDDQQPMQAMAPQQTPAPVDAGTTTPEQIDDLAINYLQNPYFLYGGAGNLFQPYGYAPGTMVDLLQTRGMTMPDQAAPNLNLFGNPTDFT